MELPFFIVNSFTVTDPDTNKQIGGNGAAVLFLDNKDQLSDDEQLNIAKLFPKLTEAVFVYPCDPSSGVSLGMRYWSPQRFCEYSITGHPTVAAVYAMLTRNHLIMADGSESYMLETKACNVPINVNRVEQRAYMGQMPPQFQDVSAEDEREIYKTFGLKEGDIVSPIKAVNMGLGYFIFKIKDVDTLMKIERDLPKLIDLNKKYGLNGGAQPYADTPTPGYDLRTRNLDLRPVNADGVWLEDSACGQGSASLMAYLVKYLDHSDKPVRMEQGVPSEPCCVEAFGRKANGTVEVFIGGKGLEIETGVISIVDQQASVVRQCNKPSTCVLS